jgi:hypothetical protein
VARLAGECGIHLLRPGRWSQVEFDDLLQAVEDLSFFLGGPDAFRNGLGRVLVWRTQRRSRMAAMALPLAGVIFFEGASWRDPPEFKWQSVHELAHVWDMHSFYRLSRGLLGATGSRYGRFKWQSPIPFEYKPGGRWLEGRPPPLNALEDWADSVAIYVYPGHAEAARAGQRLISPARWNYVAQQMQVRQTYPARWVPYFYGPQGIGPAPI